MAFSPSRFVGKAGRPVEVRVMHLGALVKGEVVDVNSVGAGIFHGRMGQDSSEGSGMRRRRRHATLIHFNLIEEGQDISAVGHAG